MMKKYVTVEVVYDTEETWEKTFKEIQEIMDMMKTVSRSAKIIEIERGVNTND
jgi:hypothetical protein